MERLSVHDAPPSSLASVPEIVAIAGAAGPATAVPPAPVALPASRLPRPPKDLY
jgi:hypothetical protein